MKELNSAALAAGTLGLLSFYGCVAQTDSSTKGGDISQEVAGLNVEEDGKADLPSYVRLVGSLAYGETSARVSSTGRPRYRAFKFAGQPGDEVDIWVRATNRGDAVTWLLNDSFQVLAYNDDASSSNLDSHITATLTANVRPEIVTYYIVFRDYYDRSRRFTVSLEGPADDFYSCEVDADCVKVNEGCCPHQGNTAVNIDSTDEYRASLGCAEPTFCIAIAVPPDPRVAQCNNESQLCELIQPEDIQCGGFRVSNPHECPDGFRCVGDALLVDGPGECRQFCGGIAPGAFPCPDGQECVDDPTDDCDPAAGGADCGGICEDAIPPGDCRTTGCIAGRTCEVCWSGYACLPPGVIC